MNRNIFIIHGIGKCNMAKVELGNDFDEYLKRLEKLEKSKIIPVMKMSVYDGADIMADGIRSEIESIPAAKSLREGVTKSDKNDLLQGLGISKFDTKDGVNVKIGFAGYGHKNKYYPNGVPIPLTARSILKGTSLRPRNNFISRAVRKHKNNVIKKMDDTINKQLRKEIE